MIARVSWFRLDLTFPKLAPGDSALIMRDVSRNQAYSIDLELP